MSLRAFPPSSTLSPAYFPSQPSKIILFPVRSSSRFLHHDSSRTTRISLSASSVFACYVIIGWQPHALAGNRSRPTPAPLGPSLQLADPFPYQLLQTSDKGEDDRLVYGLSAMQGWRISMEDAHTAVLDLGNPSPSDSKAVPAKLSFFGVFDGHGGEKVALFAGENIHSIIMKQDSFVTGDYAQGLRDGFLATDRAILNGTPRASSPCSARARLGLGRPVKANVGCTPRPQVRG